MRLLALVPSLYDTSPGQRFRLEQWEPWLRHWGVEITFQAFECEELHALLYQPGNVPQKLRLILCAFARRRAVLRSVRAYDAVYVFREASLLGPPIFERWVHSAGMPLIFDFDDAIFVPYVSPANGYLSWLKFPAKTRTLCRLATHVMAGNPYLAEYAQRVNRQVTVIPTTIDTEKYQPRGQWQVGDKAAPVIGWSGSYSTLQHLDGLKVALQRLAVRESFRLRVIGSPGYKIDGVDVEALPWKSATEVEDLRPIDVGIMPLPDDAWSRGKCGLKALQYMALGIPTVCSPVGVNTDIIHDGENGFLAATVDEWVAKLTRLLRSVELRQRLGLAGRATVEAHYAARVQAQRVYQILEAVCKAGRRREKVEEWGHKGPGKSPSP